MNDLRSLEGVAQLLKTKQRSRHHRRTGSGPSNPSTPAPTPASIDSCFPAEIAAKLSVLIQRGYCRPVHTQAPLLRKSHSDFVHEDIRQLLDDLDSEQSDIELRHDPCTVTLQLPDLDKLRSIDHAALEDDDEDSAAARLRDLRLDHDHHSHYLMDSDDGDDDDDTRDIYDDVPLIGIEPIRFVDYDEPQTSTDDFPAMMSMTAAELDMTEAKVEAEEEEEELFNLKEEYMEENIGGKGSFGAVVGNGAAGIVSKAFEYAACRLVAIKKCRSRKAPEERAFRREARLYRHFADNAHIVECFRCACDIDEGNLCMALEWMDLGSTDKLKVHELLIARQKELAVGHIALSVLYALEALHAELYVHNDVKPANILCNKYGEVKLSDFGCVTQLGSKHDYLTKNNGTQRYQAPEKLTKQTKYNTKTDIWSLGVSLYELLCGARPDKSEMTYVNNVPQLDPKRHRLSALCCDFVKRCLCINEKERPSAAELLQHEWLLQIQAAPLQHKWRPWLVEVTEQVHDNSRREKPRRGSSLGKELRFSSVCEARQSQTPTHNEDLLFMITALIVYYSRQNVDLSPSVESPGDEAYAAPLHRRVSRWSQCQGGFSDAQRIANMARCALCSPEMVVQRIQVTVASIKSQLNKAEVHRIDS